MAMPGIEAQSNGMVKQRDVQSSKGKAGRRSAQQRQSITPRSKGTGKQP